MEAWTTYSTLGTGASAVRLFRCNLDSDGLEDFYLVATGPESDRVQAWLSRGLTAPVQAQEYFHSAKSSEFHALVADFSGDGRADLAYSADGVLRLLEYAPSEGDLQLRAEITPFGSSTTPIQGLLVIDANGDATPDVLAWNGATLWLGSDHLAGIVDLDHDGDMDVVSGRCVLYARRPLTEVLHPRLGSPQSNRSIADVDGGSDPDFHVGLRTMERNLGEGLASSYAARFPPTPPGTSFVGPGWPGDFDGDGDSTSSSSTTQGRRCSDSACSRTSAAAPSRTAARLDRAASPSTRESWAATGPR